MLREELIQGINANNARAMDPAAWRLRWIFASLVPTGTFFTFQFQVPAAAAFFRLEYLIAAWPIVGTFRPLFVEIGDDRGQKFILTSKRPELQNGANLALFTTPTVDPNPATAGDQSAYMGMLPLNLDFPGRAVVSLNFRGATAAPNPTTVSILLAGHQKNRIG